MIAASTDAPTVQTSHQRLVDAAAEMNRRAGADRPITDPAILAKVAAIVNGGQR